MSDFVDIITQRAAANAKSDRIVDSGGQSMKTSSYSAAIGANTSPSTRNAILPRCCSRETITGVRSSSRAPPHTTSSPGRMFNDGVRGLPANTPQQPRALIVDVEPR